MEALVEMSMLADKRSFERSALPTEDQLQMHVNAKDFLSWLWRDRKVARLP
jgi:hypothetical protein